ncbi:MAG: CarD-like/TRCF domain protein [Lachnospiraceae bacterium]|nr:CarD-like/TRCF domain protein [Lachnospiraceae bacterium]
MFQKKEVIYSETIGVCIVDDIVKLADNKKDTYNYYLLRSVYDKTKKAYIPVENHTVQLRSLITLQEALTLRDAEHYDEKSEQEKGEVVYVTERVQKSRTHTPQLSENSENTVQSD